MLGIGAYLLACSQIRQGGVGRCERSDCPHNPREFLRQLTEGEVVDDFVAPIRRVSSKTKLAQHPRGQRIYRTPLCLTNHVHVFLKVIRAAAPALL